MAYETLKQLIDDNIRSGLPNKIRADVEHNTTLQAVVTSFGQDYIYTGVAVAATTSVNDDNNRYYFAATAGTYVNFLDSGATPIVVADNTIVVLKGVSDVWSADVIYDASGLQTSIDNKVDKVAGKGLSTNDFTDLEQTKLTGIEDGAQVNVGVEYTQTEKNKLISIEDGADANIGEEYTSAEQSKLLGIEAGADANIGVEYTQVEKDKLISIEDGAEVNIGEEYTSVEKAKLLGIDAGAEVNIGIEYTQVEKDKLISIEDSAEVNIGEEYTQTEKTKLIGIEDGADANNISDVNAATLTGGSNADALHSHTGTGGGSGIYTEVAAFTGVGINAALAAGENIYLPSGSYDISDIAVTIPSGKVIRFEEGAVITGTNAITGTNTLIEAGQFQIFNVALTVSGSWDYESAYVEWFGAGSGTVASSTDAAAIQKTLDTFIHRIKAYGSEYVLEQTINFPTGGEFYAPGETTFINTKDMYDTLLKVTEKPFYIEGGKWTCQGESAMTGNVPYTEYLWTFEMSWNQSAETYFDFRRNSYIKDSKLIGGAITGAINVDKHAVSCKGMKLVADPAVEANKDYGTYVENLYIGWLGKALYINGYEGGGDFGMVNSWHWNGLRLDNNYEGMEIRDRAGAHRFMGLALQPKNSGQRSGAYTGVNSGGVYTLDTNTDYSSLLSAGRYVILDEPVGEDTFAWITSSVHVGDEVTGHTQVTLSADPTGRYDPNGSYPDIQVIWASKPTISIDGQKHKIEGVFWDAWFYKSIYLGSNSSYCEMNLLCSDRLERYVINDAPQKMINSIGYDSYFKDGEYRYGHITTREEIKQIRLGCDGDWEGGGLPGQDYDTKLVVGGNVDLWGSLDGGASDGYIKFDGDTRINIGGPDYTKIRKGLVVDGHLMSNSNCGSGSEWYNFNGTNAKGVGSGHATGSFSTYPFTMFAQGRIRSNADTIMSIAGSVNNALWIEMSSEHLRVSRRNDASAITSGASSNSSVNVLTDSGGYFTVFAIVRSNILADMWVNGVYTQLTWANSVDEITPLDLNVGTGRSGGHQYLNGNLKRAGWWERELTFNEMAFIIGSPDSIPTIGGDPYAFLGNTRTAGTWSDLSGNSRHITLSNVTII